MKKYLNFLVLVFALACLSPETYGQSLQNHPPQPKMADHVDGHRGPPCRPAAWGDGQPRGGGNIPPPVGLCLPINDYLLPLLLCGIFLGSYAIFVIKKPALISSHSAETSRKE